MDSTAKKSIKARGSINKDYYGYIFMIPFVLGVLFFSLYPIIYTFYLSLTNTTIMTKTHAFIGFTNFSKIFADKVFMNSIGITWKLWILNFIPQIGLAMLLSVWFTSTRMKIKLVGFWRSLFYLPNLLMPATVAVLFNTFLSFYGPINQFIVRTGLSPKAIEFMTSAGAMQTTVIYIQWWMWFGSTIIILTAGMTAISPSLYESAMVDGASSSQMFAKITLPLLRPILLYTLVTSLVGGMQMFDIPFLLTDGNGAPSFSIMTMNMSMFARFSSSKGHIGLASAVGVAIFCITSVVALVLFYVMRDKEDEYGKKKKGGK